MQCKLIDIVAAGHICLDIIPELQAKQTRAESIFIPGGLVHVGPATLALGGSVANTGVALHRLGAEILCVGKVGDDLLGKSVLESLRQYGDAFADAMVVAQGEATSYTIVFSPPGVDRGFLHCSGANDTFVAADLDISLWPRFRMLHFGYPPLMRGTVQDEGRGLADKFSEVQATGALVSLDMAMPAVSDAARRTNWRQWLGTVLPHVDLFLPSYDELAIMLGRESSSSADASQLAAMAAELHELGAPIVVIKLGDQGLYLRTNEQALELASRAAWSEFNWQNWKCRELLAPCFEVEVAGTTGAGDCTIAGFLMAMLQNEGPEAAIRHATTVGAYCVQSVDATSNIPPWPIIVSPEHSTMRIRKPILRLSDWRFCRHKGVYLSPMDNSF